MALASCAVTGGGSCGVTGGTGCVAGGASCGVIGGAGCEGCVTCGSSRGVTGGGACEVTGGCASRHRAAIAITPKVIALPAIIRHGTGLLTAAASGCSLGT